MHWHWFCVHLGELSEARNRSDRRGPICPWEIIFTELLKQLKSQQRAGNISTERRLRFPEWKPGVETLETEHSLEIGRNARWYNIKET